MANSIPSSMKAIRSTVKGNGTVEVVLADEPIPALRDDEVLIRMEAAPINPSDLGLLFAGADLATIRSIGTKDAPGVVADIPAGALAAMAGRLDQPMPVGNEGAGTVVQAGPSPAAQELLGQVVGLSGGATYAEYRVARASTCLKLLPGTTAREGAACFVNPLTALGMIETMRLEGHKALVHTAAASNLGQMLVRLCQAENIELVNIVRKPEQVDLLKRLGAKHVLNSASPTFRDDLTAALMETGATIAFDAIGGGTLGGQILAAMETAAVRSMPEFSRYGSTVHKQLYIYGGLDRGPTQFNRAFGMAWSMGGWLLTPFLQKVGPAVAQRLRDRVAAEIKTTFASSYTAEVSLAGMLEPAAIAVYGKQATGEKYLIIPSKG